MRAVRRMASDIVWTASAPIVLLLAESVAKHWNEECVGSKGQREKSEVKK